MITSARGIVSLLRTITRRKFLRNMSLLTTVAAARSGYADHDTRAVRQLSRTHAAVSGEGASRHAGDDMWGWAYRDDVTGAGGMDPPPPLNQYA
jgi:hypothetical protein